MNCILLEFPYFVPSYPRALKADKLSPDWIARGKIFVPLLALPCKLTEDPGNTGELLKESIRICAGFPSSPIP